MKYTYAYKTSDGTRHTASMDAASREAVFEALRVRGIKAIKVVAADGSKANGEVPPGGGFHTEARRVVAGVVIAAACVAAAVAVWLGGRASSRASAVSAKPPWRQSSPRHQIYGDPAIMEGLERGDFDEVLPRDGDRLLAVFAQPGRLMCAKGCDTRRLDAAQAKILADYAAGELAPGHDLAIAADDSREIRELKQIVNGIRDEFRNYLANGNGTPCSFWRRLNERAAAEAQIYARTLRELEHATSADAWEEKNDALRRLGLRTIPYPGE